MDLYWFSTTYSTVIVVFLSAIGIYIALIALTRLAGLRSFSKMSSFDFAVTIAIGTLVASSIIAPKTPILQGVAAIASIFILQMFVDYLRSRFPSMVKLLDNRPLLLMKNGEVLEENLKKARMSRPELRYKLREANVAQFANVKAMVLETTGDVSVIHGENEALFDEELISGVRQG